MQFNIVVDTDKPEEIQEAITVLESVYGALYYDKAPDHEDGPEFEGFEQRAGIEKVQTYEDDFTEASDASQQFNETETRVDPLETFAPESQQITVIPPHDSDNNAALAFAPPPGVEVDSEGLPWDARIHTDSKTKLKKEGTWKLKRNIDKALVAQVKAQLKQVMAIPVPSAPVHAASALPSHEIEQAPPALDPVAVFGGGNVQQQAAPVADNVVHMPNIVPPGMPAQPAAPVQQQPVQASVDFAGLIGVIGQRITANPTYNDEVLKVLNKHGVPNMPLLGSRQDLIPTISAELDQIWNNYTQS